MPGFARKIGEAAMSAIGYGAMGISTAYGSVLPDEERMKVRRALPSGCTHWDTADVYGDSEELIGKWLKKSGKRNGIFLATKFGMVLGEPPLDGRRVCGDREYAAKKLNESLRKLGVEHMDLWYLHRADKTVPIERTVPAMAEQVRQAGKVKYLGLSEVSADTLRHAHPGVNPITALEVEYSAFTMDIDDDKTGLLKTACELGVKVVAYSPVGRGLLTGAMVRMVRRTGGGIILPRFSEENFPNVLKVVDSIKAIADKHSATPGQVALAWLLAQGNDVLPIPGSTKPANIKENMAAQDVELSAEEVEEVRMLAVDADNTIGLRYPPGLAALRHSSTEY
ncbi:Aldo/keto reductase [Ganoderma leucocontextum]|nr:Aldo/keto reductase [Ganoderma leucocontextum]